MKRIFISIISLILILCMLISCTPVDNTGPSDDSGNNNNENNDQGNGEIEDEEPVTKEIYLDIMEKAISVYTINQIDDIIISSQNGNIGDQTLARVTSNIGILLANGRCENLYSRFIQLMDISCEKLPNNNAVANEFSIKELCFCLMEVEGAGIVESEKLEGWKESIRNLDPTKTYGKSNIAVLNPGKYPHNWAAFAAASEYVRQAYLGAEDTINFMDPQIYSQLTHMNENGHYLDPGNPTLYDFVTRLQLSVPLYFGYAGKHESTLSNNLKKAGEISLKLQSSTGELPFGGRSSSFLYNEAVVAGVFEFEAYRYEKAGDLEKAGEYKAAALLAAKSLLQQLEEFPGHIKNYYDPLSGMACEGYGHFNKYMATVASFTYIAYLYSDDSIEPTTCPAEQGGFVMQTDSDFHKLVANFKGYYMEFELNADPLYDANGLGRVHKAGVPSALCISNTFPTNPNYNVEKQNEFQASLSCYVENGETLYTGSEIGVKYTKKSEKITDDSLTLVMECKLKNGTVVEQTYVITESGIDITMTGQGDNGGILLPVFIFDGKNETSVELGSNSISVEYQGHTCKYTFDGTISKTDDYFFNRNGRYDLFMMQGSHLHIELG